MRKRKMRDQNYRDGKKAGLENVHQSTRMENAEPIQHLLKTYAKNTATAVEISYFDAHNYKSRSNDSKLSRGSMSK